MPARESVRSDRLVNDPDARRLASREDGDLPVPAVTGIGHAVDRDPSLTARTCCFDGELRIVWSEPVRQIAMIGATTWLAEGLRYYLGVVASRENE